MALVLKAMDMEAEGMAHMVVIIVEAVKAVEVNRLVSGRMHMVNML